MMDSTPAPLITVVTPVCDPPEDVLSAALASVRRQRYGAWEHCIVDDASTRPHVRAVLDAAAQHDPRVCVRYRSERGGIARATNDALDISRGDFVAFLDHDDELHADALAAVAAAIGTADDVDYLYTDEDKIDERGRHFDPFVKPDWSPDRFRCQMYTAHLSVVRRSMVDQVGALNPEFDGAQDWDFVLRVTGGARRIVHIPAVLYHWRALSTSTARADSGAKPYAHEAARRAIDCDLTREAVQGVCESLPGYPGLFRIRPRLRDAPTVSIVMPTGGGRRRVRGVDQVVALDAIESVTQRSTYSSYEIIAVVDEHVDAETRRAIARVGGDRLRIVDYTGAFNFSAKVNLGAEHATGDHLLFLNDDVEVLPAGWEPGADPHGASDWIEQLLVYSLQPGVGAVGAKLFFPDGRLQHVGTVVVGGTPTHALYLEPGDTPGYLGAAMLPSNYLAVTGACLMTRRACFDAVGGFDVDLPVDYNDVAFCLALRDEGYRSVYVPDVRLLHFESVTREARPVDARDLATLQRRWPEAFAEDPYYRAAFLPGRSDFTLPAYRSNGTFVHHGRVVSDIVRARELVAAGGVTLLAARVRARLRRRLNGGAG
jgi:glycosyltransferase involved in cell wall biosynthesis